MTVHLLNTSQVRSGHKIQLIDNAQEENPKRHSPGTDRLLVKK